MKKKAKKVLIVDDNSANLYLLKSLLEGEGLEVIAAENGQVALDKAHADPPDLIVADILMPVMDGYNLCRQWKSDDILKHIPFVFYTATYTGSKNEDFALGLGADRFILKPQEPDILINILEEILEENYVAKQVATKPLEEEMEFFRQYNEILFKKLEKKMLDLEISNQELRILEERYRLSFENVSDVICTIDTDLNIISISPSVEKILGYKPQDFIGRSVSNLAHIFAPESFEQAAVDISLILKGDTISATIYQFITKDGTKKYGEVTGSPIMREGKIIGMISVARDITDRNRAEEALQALTLRQEAILAAVSEIIMEVDNNKIYTWANSAGVEFFGEDVIGKEAAFYFEGEQNTYDTVRPLFNGADDIIYLESWQRRKDGEKRLLAWWCRVLKDESGQVTGALSSARDITERKQEEEVLAESEKKYRDLFDFLPIPVYEMDFEANIISANRAIYETFKGTEEDLKKGLKAWQLLSPEDMDKSSKNIERLLRGEKIRGTEYTLNRLDGSVFPGIVISSVIYSNDKPVGLRGAIIDITERKQAEEKLRASQERSQFLADVLNSSDQPFAVGYPDGRIGAHNPAFCRLTGYTSEELRSTDWARGLTPPEWFLAETKALADMERTGKPVRYEKEYIRKDGSKVSIELLSQATKNARGDTEYYYAFITDITERKRAEDKLKQSEARFRSYFELPLIGIAITSPEKGWLEGNDRLSTILGYPWSELKEMTWSELTYPNDLPHDVEHFNRVLAGEIDSYMIDKRFICKNGEIIWTSLAAGCVRKQDGTVDYFVALLEDITDRKMSLERMRKALGATVNAIAVTVEARDPYTAGHQRRVTDLARSIATEVGLTIDQIDGIRMAATIHDIGKISIPAELLSMPRKLKDVEFSLIETHVQSGYDILKDIDFPWPVARIVLEHHERMNGSGYPNRLTGENTLIESRVLSVADVVEAMASHRPYRPALGIGPALEEISKNCGILYDPEVVDACLRLFNEKGYKLIDFYTSFLSILLSEDLK